MQTIDAHEMRMPKLGLGTYRLKGADCAAAVESALRLGYRHIDTAEMYDNEEAVGQGIAASGVARDEIFLTTKVWWATSGRATRWRRAAQASLKRLGTDHVDLLLIHWPAPEMDLGDAMAKLTGIKTAGDGAGDRGSEFPVGAAAPGGVGVRGADRLQPVRVSRAAGAGADGRGRAGGGSGVGGVLPVGTG